MTAGKKGSVYRIEDALSLTGTDADRDELYKSYVGLYTQTRAERTDYNKYFITLLFTNTLFALFTTVFGATQTSAYHDLARMVLLAALATAALISAIWLCKLWTQDYVIGKQADAIAALELALFGDIIIERLKNEEMVKGLFLRRALWEINYWGLPFIFLAVFAALFLILLVHPELLPSLGNATVHNATQTATASASMPR